MLTFRERVDEAMRLVGRLLMFVVVSGVALFIFGMALKPLLPNGLPLGRDGKLIFMILVALAFGIGNVVAALGFERGNWELTGLGDLAWRPLALLGGPLLGSLAVAVPAAALLLFGVVEVVVVPAGSWSGYAGDVLLVVVIVTLAEELAFRGYVFGLLADRWGHLAAVLLTALAAGVLQMRAPESTPATFAAALSLGIFLGAIRSRTESVAASWLAHFAVFWMHGAVLHGSLRGADLRGPPGYSWVAGDPGWLTGGDAGSAEGAAAVAGLVVVTFLVFRPRRANARPARV